MCNFYLITECCQKKCLNEIKSLTEDVMKHREEGGLSFISQYIEAHEGVRQQYTYCVPTTDDKTKFVCQKAFTKLFHIKGHRLTQAQGGTIVCV